MIGCSPVGCPFEGSGNLGQAVTDVVSKEVRSRMMSSIRARDTGPEMLIRRYLHRLGFRYRLSPRDLPGRPDIVLPRYNAIVFVHGCFWHGHDGCRFATVPATRTSFWVAKISANKQRDAAIEVKLCAQGWRVAVVWECALKSNLSVAQQQVVDFIKSNDARMEITAQSLKI